MHGGSRRAGWGGSATSGHAGLGAAASSASSASAAATLEACASSCFFVSTDMPTCNRT